MIICAFAVGSCGVASCRVARTHTHTFSSITQTQKESTNTLGDTQTWIWMLIKLSMHSPLAPPMWWAGPRCAPNIEVSNSCCSNYSRYLSDSLTSSPVGSSVKLHLPIRWCRKSPINISFIDCWIGGENKSFFGCFLEPKLLWRMTIKLNTTETIKYLVSVCS